jgi:hypothetical protein
MAEKIEIDTTGLSSEMAEQINKVCEQATQSAADLEATKAEYAKVKAELDKKNEDIVALKAANMALALTGGTKKQSTEEVLCDIFDLKKGGK